MAVAQLTATRLPAIMWACQPGNCRGGSKKIAHNTDARYLDSGVEVTYHGNQIVFQKFNSPLYEITNAGWSTRTTAGRLHQITRANGGGAVNIRGGVMRYTTPSGKIYDMHGPMMIDSRTGEVVLVVDA